MRIVRRTTGNTDSSPHLTPHSLPENLHPVLRRLYLARGVRKADELGHRLLQLHPHAALKGLEQAITLLCTALREKQRILIVADFDADGATACAVAVRGLRLLGAADVRYVVPNRFDYGYGLTPEIVAVAAKQHPNLIITVDNGISSLDGVQAAHELGIKVLVTDHHLPGPSLPGADAIVNPNQPDDAFPSKNLAGVGVIFYVLLALRVGLRETGWFAERGLAEPNLAQLLDLVALGTVADVVQLDHNNRILVAQGLARIRGGQAHAGIRAIVRVAGRRIEQLAATDLGFAVGPRLNAAGRLEDMSLGIECLLCDDDSRALEMAERLNELNRERGAIEGRMQEQAMAALAAMQLDIAALPYGLCLFDPDWHQGVIGILASRIRERVHRPVIAFAQISDSEIKGSARSVPGVHIRDALDAVAARHPDLLSKFGGHAMAAGLSLKLADLERFRSAFDTEVRRHLSASEMQGLIDSDGILEAKELSLELAEALRAAGPWGQGFPEPIFDGEFQIMSLRVVGSRHLKLVLKPLDTNRTFDAIAFNGHDPNAAPPAVPATKVGDRMQVAYQLGVNDYRGERSVQLVVRHMEPLEMC